MTITEWKNGAVTVRDMTDEELEYFVRMETENADPELTAEEALAIITGGTADA